MDYDYYYIVPGSDTVCGYNYSDYEDRTFMMICSAFYRVIKEAPESELDKYIIRNLYSGILHELFRCSNIHFLTNKNKDWDIYCISNGMEEIAQFDIRVNNFLDLYSDTSKVKLMNEMLHNFKEKSYKNCINGVKYLVSVDIHKENDFIIDKIKKLFNEDDRVEVPEYQEICVCTVVKDSEKSKKEIAYRICISMIKYRNNVVSEEHLSKGGESSLNIKDIILNADITKLSGIECIVNTIFENCNNKSRYNRSVYKGTGDGFFELKKRYQLPGIGRFALTPGFGLKYKYILHTTIPMAIRDDGHFCYNEVYFNLIRVAHEYGIKSIAIPITAFGNDFEVNQFYGAISSVSYCLRKIKNIDIYLIGDKYGAII